MFMCSVASTSAFCTLKSSNTPMVTEDVFVIVLKWSIQADMTKCMYACLVSSSPVLRMMMRMFLRELDTFFPVPSPPDLSARSSSEQPPWRARWHPWGERVRSEARHAAHRQVAAAASAREHDGDCRPRRSRLHPERLDATALQEPAAERKGALITASCVFSGTLTKSLGKSSLSRFAYPGNSDDRLRIFLKGNTPAWSTCLKFLLKERNSRTLSLCADKTEAFAFEAVFLRMRMESDCRLLSSFLDCEAGKPFFLWCQCIILTSAPTRSHCGR